jgi:glycosyltransferase involved in cell wall biosynthesis
MIYQTEELLPQLMALLDQHPNKNAVILVGKVDNDHLLYWYNSADFLLSGSHYEGSGTAVCEAMSCGCIPVVTDIASFRMITNNGDCGILYSAGDEEALVNALHQTQTLDRKKYRQKCLDWYDEKLSFKAIARDIEAVANSIVK